MTKKSEVFDSAKYPGFYAIDDKKRVSIPVAAGRSFLRKNELGQNLPDQLTIIPNERGTALLAMTNMQYESLVKRLVSEKHKFRDLVYATFLQLKLDLTHKVGDSSQELETEGDPETISSFRLGPLSPLFSFGFIEPEEKLRIVCVEQESPACLQIYPAEFKGGELQKFSDLRPRIEKVCQFYKFD